MAAEKPASSFSTNPTLCPPSNPVPWQDSPAWMDAASNIPLSLCLFPVGLHPCQLLHSPSHPPMKLLMAGDVKAEAEGSSEG